MYLFVPPLNQNNRITYVGGNKEIMGSGLGGGGGIILRVSFIFYYGIIPTEILLFCLIMILVLSVRYII